MGSLGGRKPHAVCVPYPSQGHVTPMMQLAKLLHSRGFHITFVNTEFNHTIDPDFRFETIPDGLPQSTFDATQDVPSLCDSTRKNCLAPFKELVSKLNSSSSTELPPVSCIISDGVMSFGIIAAEELSIPQVQFWTASACSFMAYLHYNELERRGIMPYKVENFLNDGISNTPIVWISGMTNIRLKDMPRFIKTSTDEIMYDFMGSEAWNCLNSSAIIFNTFDEFEYEVLEAITADKFPHKIYTIGPLNLLAGDISERHLKEFAWGLANSKHPFLWIIRHDIVMGDSAILPQEFIEEIKDRGFLATVSHGVPIICWPFFADQQTNCRYACTKWGNGMEVNHDVKRKEIEGLVKEMMEGDDGKRKREKALEWRRKAEEATSVGGSSYNNFSRFIKEALHCDEQLVE
ncbi:UDP-glucuronosyltransferase, putative [Ricinus communis]|uniref:UDP-glucuronosyltransferase, putative n=1 Tax=Ricinus communis TaxID=3988 RepID=B9T3Q9_RICCO|nr:UDP-glucuronosyltransferase, putative [Ricinus communis]